MEETRFAAAKTVDGLVGITDDAEVSVGRDEESDETILSLVDVLEFVHRDVLEVPAILSEHFGMGFEQFNREPDEIVGGVLQKLFVRLKRASDVLMLFGGSRETASLAEVRLRSGFKLPEIAIGRSADEADDEDGDVVGRSVAAQRVQQTLGDVICAHVGQLGGGVDEAT